MSSPPEQQDKSELDQLDDQDDVKSSGDAGMLSFFILFVYRIHIRRV